MAALTFRGALKSRIKKVFRFSKKRVSAKKARENGFSLLEALVTVVLIGIIFALVSPGWNAFFSRQQVGTAREQAIQIIRSAQSLARANKIPQVVVFDSNPSGTPRVGSRALQSSLDMAANGTVDTTRLVDPTRIGNWTYLGTSGEISSQAQKVIGLRGNSAIAGGQYYWLIFDGSGGVADTSSGIAGVSNQLLPLPDGTKGFVITAFRQGASGNGTNRCLIVNTLLGAIRQADGGSCP
jgi:prepilin-type N-terminal cleavage/methylation domain-containing protein